MNSIRSKKNLESRLRGLIAGTTQHFPNATPVTFGGQTFTSAALVQFLSELLAAIVAVNAATVALRDAVKAERAKKAVAGPIVLAYQSYLLALFGNASTALADFDLMPVKSPTPLTAEQKLTAANRRLATRAARHTLGSKKKLSIKGAAVPPTGGSAVAGNGGGVVPPKVGA